MGRWQIDTQASGIADPMRMNILSTISTAIDTHGSSNMYNIAKDVKSWLEHTYEKIWAVIIYKPGQGTICCTYYDNKYLLVKETNLDWYIAVIQATA